MSQHTQEQESLPAGEELTHIREYLSRSGPTAHYPVPSAWVEWLLAKYELVVGAIRPLSARKFVAMAFADMDDVMKLTMIYREVEGANTCGLPTPMVPASWVEWLLADYDRKSSAPKVKEIYERTQNGTLLSPRDFEITTLATSAKLSQRGWEEFDELCKNVLFGDYLDPESTSYPWFHGIKYLTQDHSGFVYWKGQKVGYRPFGREHLQSEEAVVKQLALECITAESMGRALPRVTEQPQVA